MSERTPEPEIHVAASRGERALGRAVQKTLRGAGLRAWDGEGESLRDIDAGLTRSRHVVLILGEDTPAAWVEAELQAVSRAAALAGGEGIGVVALTRGATAKAPEGLPSLSLPNEGALQPDDLRDLVTYLRGGKEQSATSLAAKRVDCPYPGLRPFEARDAAWFFGRGAETAEALTRLGELGGGFRRWLEIEGGPGMGKSSLARAGLVPAFQRGMLHGAPSEWMVASCRPGRHPVGHLALALTRAFGGVLWYGEVLEALQAEGGLCDLIRDNVPADRGLLLLVDGLDDAVDAIAGQGDDPEGYTLLDRRLAEALADFDHRFFLLTTVRSDVRAHVHAVLPRLAALAPTSGARYALGAMSGAGLAEAIAGPGRLFDRMWPEPLYERILLDATEAGVSLPAVAHLLRVLWIESGPGGPTVETYEKLGAVAGALDAAAERLMATLDPEERDRARRLLAALVRPGRGFADRARSLTAEEAITAAGGGPRGELILERLVGDPEQGAFALLAIDRGEGPEERGPADPPPGATPEEPVEWVHLAHDSLLVHWAALRGWVAAERPALERRDDVERAARAWVAAGSPPTELPAGRLLAHYEGDDLPAHAAADLPSLLGAPARRFVEAARATENKLHESLRNEKAAGEAADRARKNNEAARRAASVRRMRVAVGALALALVVTLVWALRLVNNRAELHTQLDMANQMHWRAQTQLGEIEQQRHDAEKSLLDARQLVRAAERQRREADREGVNAEMNADEVLGIAGRIADQADTLLTRVSGKDGKFARRALAFGVLGELERALAGAPDNQLLRVALARQRQRVAEIALDDNEVGTALAQYEKVIPVLESLTSGEGASVTHLRALADAYDWLGEFRARDRKNPQWQDPKAALDWFDKERGALERLAALEPDVDDHPRRLTTLLTRTGAIRLEEGDAAGARVDLARAVDVQRAVVDRRPGDPEPVRRLATLVERQGDLEADARAYDDARRYYDDARDRLQPLAADAEADRLRRRLARKLKTLP